MKLPRDLEWTGDHDWPIRYVELNQAVHTHLRAIAGERGLRFETTSIDKTTLITLENPKLGLAFDVMFERINNEWSRLRLWPPGPGRNDEPFMGTAEEQARAIAELEEIGRELHRSLLAQNPRLMEHELGQVLLGWLNRGVYGNEAQGGRLHALVIAEWTFKGSKDGLALLIPQVNDALASPGGCPGHALWLVKQDQRLLCSIGATTAYEPVGVLDALDLGDTCILRVGLELSPQGDSPSPGEPHSRGFVAWLQGWLETHRFVDTPISSEVPNPRPRPGEIVAVSARSRSPIKGGRAKLERSDHREYIRRLALAQEAEEAKLRDPEMLFRDIARQIGWLSSSKRDLATLRYWRDELKTASPETLREIAEHREKNARITR